MKTAGAPRPPRLAEALLDLLVPVLEREFVRGDLEESFRRKCEVQGVRQARKHYRRQVLSLAPLRLRTRNRHDPQESSMGLLLQDLKYGWRSLQHNLRFSVTAVVTLALGIGLNTAVFTVFDTLFLRPLPVERPEELVRIFARELDTGRYYDSASYATMQDIEAQSETLAGVGAKSLTPASLTVSGTSQLVFGEVVSGNYFDTLRVDPMLGRRFRPEETTLGGEPAVILGHALWTERFQADPSLVGQTVGMNSRPFTVVGVAPPEFRGTKAMLSMDFWVPAETWNGPGNWTESRTRRWLQLIGRLAPGVPIEEAEAELRVIAARMADRHTEEQGRSLELLPARGLALDIDPGMASTARLGGSLALGAVGLVLFVACANIASLLLARASARRQEIGVRMAMGASRWRVIRQVLTESLLLAFLGGAAGLLVAFWAARSLMVLFPVMPYTVAFDATPNFRILLFAFALSTLTGVVFGLAPAFRSVRTGLVTSLRSSSGATAGRRRPGLGQLIVVTQVAFSVVLLVVSGFFVRSLNNLTTVETGFDRERVAFLTVDFGLIGLDRDAGSLLYDELERRLAALPGVASMGFASNLPLDDASEGARCWGEGVSADDERGLRVEFAAVTPDYFQAIGIDLLEGRTFVREDVPDSSQVIIIDRALQERLWPGTQAVGRRLSLRGPTGPFMEIVGVVDGVKQHALVGPPTPSVYRPLSQSYSPAAAAVLKTRTDPASVLQPARRAIRALNPDVPVFNVRTLDDLMTFPLYPFRIGATLASVFGLLALLLTASGVYGLVSYTVARRTSEIGIRIALGAAGRDVRSMVVRQGVLLLAIGGGIGLIVSIFVPGVLASALLGVEWSDPLVLVVVAAIIGSVTLAASYLPALRASRIDPIRALRTE